MRINRSGGETPYKRYGKKVPNVTRDVTMESLAEGDVGRLMSMLSGMAGPSPVDYSMTSAPEMPYFRFRNIASENPSARDIIRGQVYDVDREGYGGDVTLDQMIRMAERDPRLRDELEKNFMLQGADKKAFQKRFNSDPNFARLFVDLYGERGEIGDINAINRGKDKGDRESGYLSGVDRTGAAACLGAERGSGKFKGGCQSDAKRANQMALGSIMGRGKN